MNPLDDHGQLLNRRRFIQGSGLRAGGIALGLMAAQARRSAAAGTVHPALPGLPHFAPKAKALIYLHMNGGPTQLDLWDYKPQLQAHFDKDLPDSVRGGQRITTMTSGQSRLPIAPTRYKFEQAGKCGTWINTELLPNLAK